MKLSEDYGLYGFKGKNSGLSGGMRRRDALTKVILPSYVPLILSSMKVNMVITSIIILCAIAMVFYKLIQSAEHYYKKKY